MASTGTDIRTGQVLRDFDHVLQSVDVIFGIFRGEMVMLRWFGSGLPELLGRRIIPRTVSLYYALIALAIGTWEPRLQVVAVRTRDSSVEAVQLGQLSFEVLCYYRPNALDGDFTVEGGLRRLGNSASDRGVTVADLDDDDTSEA